MNRIIYTILLFAFSYTASQAQTRVYNCDFSNEESLDSFIIKDYDMLKPKEGLGYPEGKAWCIWQDPDDEKNYVAGSCSYYENGGQANDWLVMANIALPEDSAACQLYWRSRSAWNTYKDGYILAVSTDSIDARQEIGEYKWKTAKLITNSNSPAEWKSWHQDLSEYAGDTISIAFINSTENGWMLFLDDITVGERECVSKGFVDIDDNEFVSGDKGYISARFKGGILDETTSFTARITTHEDTIVQSYSNLEIKPNGIFNFKIDTPLTGIAPETKSFRLELLDAKDNCFASDSGHFVYLIDLKGESNVVAECCINNNDVYSLGTIIGYSKLAEEPWFIGLQLHGSEGEDPMTPQDKEDYELLLMEKLGVSTCETVIIDRTSKGNAYNDIGKLATERLNKPLFLTSDIYGFSNDTVIEINTATVFAIDSKLVNYSYEFILTEDSVWNKIWNMYSGGVLGEFHGYESLGYEVDMAFNDVVRKRYKYEGMQFGDSILAGDTVTGCFTFAFEQNIIEPRLLNMTMIVTDDQSGEIVNASRCRLEYKGTRPTVTNIAKIEGTTKLEFNDDTVTYYGNSTAEIRVFNIFGAELLHCTGHKDASFQLPEEKGIYIIEVQENGNRYIKKIMR